MPICRNKLHESKFEMFREFLRRDGWSILPVTNIYEVVRAKKTGEKTIVLYQRDGTDHATIGWNMEHALRLVKKFIRGKYDR